jgi:hypothetical protein
MRRTRTSRSTHAISRSLFVIVDRERGLHQVVIFSRQRFGYRQGDRQGCHAALSVSTIARRNEGMAAPRSAAATLHRQPLHDYREFNRKMDTVSAGSVAYVPQPVRDEVQVSVTLDHQAGAQLTLVDSHGRELANFWISSEKTLIVQRFSVADLPPGMYFVRLRCDRIVRSEPLMILH